jgi:hypothetical protein
MIIKLDMANTFDKVKHRFLLVVLIFFGFDLSFLNWVVAYFSYPWIAPLFNGHPTLFFEPLVVSVRGAHSPQFFTFLWKRLSIEPWNMQEDKDPSLV